MHDFICQHQTIVRHIFDLLWEFTAPGVHKECRGTSTAPRLVECSGIKASRMLAFGLSFCRPHLMPSTFLMPSMFKSSFHAFLPFQTKTAGAPHSSQAHLQAEQTPLILSRCSSTSKCTGNSQALGSGDTAVNTYTYHDGRRRTATWRQ